MCTSSHMLFLRRCMSACYCWKLCQKAMGFESDEPDELTRNFQSEIQRLFPYIVELSCPIKKTLNFALKSEQQIVILVFQHISECNNIFWATNGNNNGSSFEPFRRSLHRKGFETVRRKCVKSEKFWGCRVDSFQAKQSLLCSNVLFSSFVCLYDWFHQHENATWTIQCKKQ